jgi:hypothetical protein
MDSKTSERTVEDIIFAIFLILSLSIPAFIFQPEVFISTESTGHGVSLPAGYRIQLGNHVVTSGVINRLVMNVPKNP